MASVRHNFHLDCERAINQLINNELASSYFYLSLAYHFDRDDVALKNFHQYSCKLSSAKKANAERLMKLMNERGGRVTLADVPTPANNFGEPIEIMQVLLQHEKQEIDLGQVKEKRLTVIPGDPEKSDPRKSVIERKSNEHLLALTSLAEKCKDPMLHDFMEEYFLNPKVELLKELGNHITNLKKVGNGLGVYIFDQETLGK